jgi:hypothetical protein
LASEVEGLAEAPTEPRPPLFDCHDRIDWLVAESECIGWLVRVERVDNQPVRESFYWVHNSGIVACDRIDGTTREENRAWHQSQHEGSSYHDPDWKSQILDLLEEHG